MMYGFGPGMGVFGWLMMALMILPLWGLLITAVIALYRFTNDPVGRSTMPPAEPGGPRSGGSR